jgi:hypothetical protein
MQTLGASTSTQPSSPDCNLFIPTFSGVPVPSPSLHTSQALEIRLCFFSSSITFKTSSSASASFVWDLCCLAKVSEGIEVVSLFTVDRAADPVHWSRDHLLSSIFAFTRFDSLRLLCLSVPTRTSHFFGRLPHGERVTLHYTVLHIQRSPRTSVSTLSNVKLRGKRTKLPSHAPKSLYNYTRHSESTVNPQ